MIDQDFCAFLEYELTKALHNTDKSSLKGFWCDGILPPTLDNETLKKTINDKRQLALTAFIGKDGQDTYDMLLIFGNNSVSKISRNLSVIDCVPTNERDWYAINVVEKTITIQML